MMLVQKPPNLPTTMHNHHYHRRFPSAPVVVHPTRTPGLLSLSLPPKPASTRQQQHQSQQRHRSPKSKPAGPHNRSPQPTPAEPQQNEAETSKKAQQQPTPASSPDKHVRGRQQQKPVAVKDKIARRCLLSSSVMAVVLKLRLSSTSPSSLPGVQVRRNIARQPSPPVQTTTSQAEGQLSFANNNSKSNLFDPFIVSSGSDTDNNAPRPPTTKPATTPKLTNPSGKLARRRQRPTAATAAVTTPTPSKPVPVPRSKRHARAHSAMMNISRSAPIISPLSNMGGAFPVCDDMTDADGLTPPSTPTRKSSTWQQASYNDGPRTAPLSSTSGFPFGNTSSKGGRRSPTSTPSPTHRHRNHLRSPSEGMFSLSFDEDSASSSDNANEELKMLFGLKHPNKRGQGQNLRGLVHVSNTQQLQQTPASKAAKAALYASSLFQNSPSPDELPPPAF